MKIYYSFAVFSLSSNLLHVNAQISPDNAQGCNAQRAYSILQSVSTASGFCSSLIYPNGPIKKTVTTTETVPQYPCKTKKEISTIRTKDTTTKIHTKTTTLPTITLTAYSQTVLIPSGTTRVVNKRAVAPDAKVNPTPTALRTCSKSVIEKACKSVVPSDATTTKTVTKEHTSLCTYTDSETTTVYAHTITSTYILEASPPAIVIQAPASVTLTTTVPADCASNPYITDGNSGLPGDLIIVQTYPHFPQTDVECCVICAQTQNCVAAAILSDEFGRLIECQALLRATPLEGGATSQMCPLGIEDYPFGPPDPTGNIFPGPCGF